MLQQTREALIRQRGEADNGVVYARSQFEALEYNVTEVIEPKAANPRIRLATPRDCRPSSTDSRCIWRCNAYSVPE
eukprot:975238-Pyramimonas_sp.AAC.1